MDTSSSCWLEEVDFACLWILGKCLHKWIHNLHLPVVKEDFQMQSAGHQWPKLLKLFSSLSLKKNNETFFKGTVEKAILHLVRLSRATFSFPA